MTHENQNQIDHLGQQSNELSLQGQLRQAIDITTQICDLIRQDPVINYQKLATNLEVLALLYYRIHDYKNAEPLYLEILDIKKRVYGEDHNEYIITLDNLALLYREKGDFVNAEQYYRKSLEVCRMLYGENHLEFAKALFNIAEVYRLTSDYINAEPLYEGACEIYRTHNKENSPEYAITIDNLGLVYQAKGELDRAEPLHIQAKEIRRRSLGENHPEYTTSLNNLGLLYMHMPSYDKAEPLFLEALQIRLRIFGKAHLYTALSLYNLAELYFARGDFDKAEKYYRESLDVYRVPEVRGENHPDFTHTLNAIGDMYRLKGNYSKSEKCFLQALNIQRLVLGENHPDYAITLDNLAELYRSMGNFRKAAPLYIKALNIFGKKFGEYNLDYAKCVNNMAAMYHDIGDLSKAEAYFLRAKSIVERLLGKNHPEVATILDNLSNLYRSAGEYTKAEPLNKQALELYRVSVGENHPDYAISLGTLASLYEEMGKFAEAEALKKEALEIYEKTVGESNSNYGLGMMDLGLNYFIQSDYAKAEQCFIRAKEILETLRESHPTYLLSLMNLANLYDAMGRYDDAMNLEKNVVNIEDNIINQIFSVASERQRLIWIRSLQNNLYHFLSLIREHFYTSPQMVCAALDLVLKRKGIGLEVLAAQRNALLVNKYPEIEQKLTALRDVTKQITQIQMASIRPAVNSGAAEDDDRESLATKRAWQEYLEEYLSNQIPEVWFENTFKVPHRQKISDILAKEEEKAALIEFVKIDMPNLRLLNTEKGLSPKLGRYVAFVLSGVRGDNQDSVQMIGLDEEAESIDRAINTYIDSIKKISDYDVIDKLGSELRKKVFDPLKDAISNCTRLFIAPDGELTKLPFESLPIDVSNDKYLLDCYNISYVSTGRDLLYFNIFSASGKYTNPVVAADPNFDLASASLGLVTKRSEEVKDSMLSSNLDRISIQIPFKRLPATKEEGKDIASILGVEALFQDQVLESKIKACKSPRILHISTHGFFEPNQQDDLNIKEINRASTDLGFKSLQKLKNPLLRSGLALAGANTWFKKVDTPMPEEAEDGLLTAQDVTDMDLISTELVVLSACDTGLGDLLIGEGVFGLRRSFVLAGAKTLIMSLWRVPDKQTKKLMVDFYKHMLSGKPRYAALREAQLQMKEKYPNPYVWGAFICQGNPEPLLSVNSIKKKN